MSTPVAVITGAAGSIGSRLRQRFAEAGYDVVGIDLASACPAGDERSFGCDITDEQQVRHTFDAILARTGRIDVLVHNAGVSAIGKFLDHGTDTHRRVMAVNYLGSVACTQAALPALRDSRGRIVVISSVTGFAPVIGRPAYVAAKHALTGLFDSLRPELAPDGVGVTLVHPTFLTEGMGEAAERAEGRERPTTGAEITADDVANAVVEAVRTGRDRVLVGRTAWLSWHVRRLLPATYVRMMTRRLAK